MLEMPTRTFLLWNVVGGILWTDGILLVGYTLSRQITRFVPAESIDRFLLPVIALIVLISVMPIVIEIVKTRREAKRTRAANAAMAAAQGDDVGRHRS
jgi:membrane-associated protein